MRRLKLTVRVLTLGGRSLTMRVRLLTLGVRCEVKITSAHRTPEATRGYVEDADQRGCAVFIAAESRQ